MSLNVSKASKAPASSSIVWALSLVAVGCVSNNMFLELLVSKKANRWADPACGSLLTLLQFVFIAAMALPAVLQRREATFTRSAAIRSWCARLPLSFKRTIIPLKHYVGQTALYFAMSFLNNIAFAFNISQPLHMVFRSANLISTVALGYFAFNKKFSAPQLLCVAIITLGALSSTLAEAFLGDAASAARSSGSSSGNSSPLAADALIPNSVDSESGARASPTPLRGAISAAFAAVTEKAGVSSGDAGSAASSSSYMLVWITGIGILTLVLAIQSCLGFYQSWTAATFGRSPSETMFYMHVMALPGFVFALSAIPERVAVWNASPATYEALNDMLASGSTSPYLVLLLRLVSLPLRNVPIMWTFVLLNVLTQYVGIVGVYNLTPVVSPLTLNVVLTVRKCVSLLLSIYAFNNTFTVLHWLGALLVFGAALWYGRIQSQPSPTISGTPSASHVAPALSPREDDKATVTVPPSGLEGAKVRQKTLAHAAPHHR